MSKNRLVAFSIVVLSFIASIGLIRRLCYLPPPVSRDLSAGATIQRARIDRVIDSTEAVGLQEAIDTLENYCEAYELAAAAKYTPSNLNAHYMSQVLSDRRACKIFEHIKNLSSEQASVLAEQVFDSKFAAFVAEWNKFAQTLGNEETGPKHHAASIGLFLCSYFCPPERLDQKIAMWSNFVKEKKFDSIPGVFALQRSRFVDRLFHINLLVISGERAGASTGRLNSVLQTFASKVNGAFYSRFQVSELQLFKWHAETLSTDFTHITRGVPASGNEVLVTLPGFADPDSRSFIQDQNVFDAVVQLINDWRRGR